MGQGQHPEREGNGKVHDAPLLYEVQRQAIAVQLLIGTVGGDAIGTQLLACLSQALPGAFEQVFAGQPTGDIDQHGADRQPSEQGVEMDAGMDQHQQRAHPGQAFMQTQ